eukprot:8107369-Pyramimonas_sp.AAC.1
MACAERIRMRARALLFEETRMAYQWWALGKGYVSGVRVGGRGCAGLPALGCYRRASTRLLVQMTS